MDSVFSVTGPFIFSASGVVLHAPRPLVYTAYTKQVKNVGKNLVYGGTNFHKVFYYKKIMQRLKDTYENDI